MKYTVVWLPSAINELADIYNEASDRQKVTQASNRIDQRLKYDPERQGQVMHGRWIIVEAPLVVTFAIYSDDCLVEVLQVRRI